MGYIKTFSENLDSMLRRFGLTDEERNTVVSYVKEVVIESYKNGIEQGKGEGSDSKPTERQKPRSCE